jgi:predicted CXXCH cytochrome family protein
MRAGWLVLVLLAGCSPAHTSIDRLDCQSCHGELYETAPEHVEEAYPRTCYQCHGTSTWPEAEEHHDRFRIDRGGHAGWDCADCHASATDRQVLRCTGCHAHDEARTRARHRGVAGFTYTPSSCFPCHGGG